MPSSSEVSSSSRSSSISQLFIRHVNNIVCGRYLFSLYPLLGHPNHTPNGFLAALTLLFQITGRTSNLRGRKFGLCLLVRISVCFHLICRLGWGRYNTAHSLPSSAYHLHFSPTEISWVVKVSSECFPKHPEGSWSGHLGNGKATCRNEAVVSSTVHLHGLWSFMQPRQPCLWI